MLTRRIFLRGAVGAAGAALSASMLTKAVDAKEPAPVVVPGHSATLAGPTITLAGPLSGNTGFSLTNDVGPHTHQIVYGIFDAIPSHSL